MNKTLAAISALTLGLAASTLAHATPPASADPVAAAFDRMLSHAPAHVTPAAAVAKSSDPLLDHLVASLARYRTGGAAQAVTEPAASNASRQLPTAAREDQLAASFQRMLGHQAGNGEPQHTAEAAPDPLLKQLTAALWPERTAQRQP
jgi:hypothetical protein